MPDFIDEFFNETTNLNSLGPFSSVTEDQSGKDEVQPEYPDEGARSAGLCKCN